VESREEMTLNKWLAQPPILEETTIERGEIRFILLHLSHKRPRGPRASMK
jgi:hypothetical protein